MVKLTTIFRYISWMITLTAVISPSNAAAFTARNSIHLASSYASSSLNSFASKTKTKQPTSSTRTNSHIYACSPWQLNRRGESWINNSIKMDMSNQCGNNDDGNNDAQKTKMIILGICGGIGSGKSTACQLMVESLGCAARIDADLLAHGVYEPGSQAWQEIIAEFGEEILLPDDESSSSFRGIDRRKLGSIVFSDSKSMSKLESIVWPHVRTKIEERIEQITDHHASSPSRQNHSTTAAPNEIIIVEAALLMETNWHDLLDGLWVVQASQPVVLQRLKENRGLTEEEAMVRIRAQEQRRGIGGTAVITDGGEDFGIISKLQEEMDDGIVTAVITNDGTLEDLQHILDKALHDPTSFKK